MINNPHKYDTLDRLASLAEKVLLNYTRTKFTLFFLNSPIVISCLLAFVSILQLKIVFGKYTTVLSLASIFLALIAIFLDLRSNTRIQYKQTLKILDKLMSQLHTLYRTIERSGEETDYLTYEGVIELHEKNVSEIINDLSFQLKTAKCARRKMKKTVEYNWIAEAKSYNLAFREESKRQLT